MEQPLVTVMVPVYNQQTYLSHCIESVIFQTYRNWRLLIVDDASTDKTPEIAANFLVDERISYVRLPVNVGTGKALAEAFPLIKTPYFVILDSDDWLETTALEILLQEMEQQPIYTSLVYSNTVVWKENSEGNLIRKVKRHQSYQDKYQFLLKKEMVYPRFFRTQCVLDIGGFDNEIPYEGRFMEDRYLLLRLIENTKFHWIDRDLYHLRRHHHSVSNKGNRPKFAEVKKYIYKKMLKKWGGNYKPIFGMSKSGWLHLKRLKPRETND